MTKRLTPSAPAPLDETDRALLAALAEDARQPVSELARLVGLSAPSTAERVRRLEAQGVIERFTVHIDPRALGYTLQAIVRVKPLPGQLHLVEEVIRRIPEFVECDKVTGDDCFICRLYLQSIEQLDEILTKVAERAETSSAIVKSTPVAPLAAARLDEARVRVRGGTKGTKRLSYCSTASKKDSISATSSLDASSGM
ncbi:Lrp/AsnC family transcriptional regulator, leucine-responsive regulatory protein [Burkholderia sp. WP9]|nr:Lrp/AsnC family transcriptional regulator [Burkholderia sp. WP9]SED33603.1 Lrp/AsnC family transcriptional regulator, leucine-responsive regulatory protein [Burkholderia sp. WP9]